MATLPHTRSRRLKPGKAGIVLLSLALHGLLLTPLALNLFRSTPQRPEALYRTPIYIDVVPRPLGLVAPERNPSDRSDRAENMVKAIRPAQEPEITAKPPSPASVREQEPPTSGATDNDRWRLRPDAPGERIRAALRRGAIGCRALTGRLDPAEQARCDQMFARAAVRSAPIIGTDNPVRDARFAAIGDLALADYDRRRAPLKPNSRANPCPESPDPGDPCAFSIQGRIWSSRDGWLPDLPGRP